MDGRRPACPSRNRRKRCDTIRINHCFNRNWRCCRNNAYIVCDNTIQYGALVGQNFTKLPGIIIIKTAESLIIKLELPAKLLFSLCKDIETQLGETIVVLIYCDANYSGNVYVKGFFRENIKKEYYLLLGKYEIRRGRGGGAKLLSITS